jgi:hypothetical protein
VWKGHRIQLSKPAACSHQQEGRPVFQSIRVCLFSAFAAPYLSSETQLALEPLLSRGAGGRKGIPGRSKSASFAGRNDWSKVKTRGFRVDREAQAVSGEMTRSKDKGVRGRPRFSIFPSLQPLHAHEQDLLACSAGSLLAISDPCRPRLIDLESTHTRRDHTILI